MPRIDDFVKETASVEGHTKTALEAAKLTGFDLNSEKVESESSKELPKFNSVSEEETSPNEQIRRPFSGYRSRVEKLRVIKELKKHAPEKYNKVMQAIELWSQDGDFARLELKPRVLKEIVTRVLTTARTVEQKHIPHTLKQRVYKVFSSL